MIDIWYMIYDMIYVTIYYIFYIILYYGTTVVYEVRRWPKRRYAAHDFITPNFSPLIIKEM
jgi:hypothetical protein